MAAARVNVPTIFVSGGPMLAGRKMDGKRTCLSSLFEAVGQFNAGNMTEDKLHEFEQKLVQLAVHVQVCIQQTQ